MMFYMYVVTDFYLIIYHKPPSQPDPDLPDDRAEQQQVQKEDQGPIPAQISVNEG